MIFNKYVNKYVKGKSKSEWIKNDFSANSRMKMYIIQKQIKWLIQNTVLRIIFWLSLFHFISSEIIKQKCWIKKIINMITFLVIVWSIFIDL